MSKAQAHAPVEATGNMHMGRLHDICCMFSESVGAQTEVSVHLLGLDTMCQPNLHALAMNILPTASLTPGEMQHICTMYIIVANRTQVSLLHGFTSCACTGSHVLGSCPWT